MSKLGALKFDRWRARAGVIAQWKTSLRSSLLLPAAAITLLLSFALVGIGYWVGEELARSLCDQLMRQTADAIRIHVGMMLDAPAKTLARARNSLARHGVPLDDPSALAKELHGLLANEPVDWLFFGNRAGGLISAGRLADGTTVTAMTDGFQPGVSREYTALPDGDIGQLRKSGADFDARRKGWYRRTKETGRLSWTQPYLGSVEPILGISLAVPVTDRNGGFAGVLGVDMILTQMSQYLSGLSVGQTGRAFLMDDKGLLIASSGGVVPTAAGVGGEEQRLLARASDDAVVRATARYLDSHPGIAERAYFIGMQSLSFEDPALGELYVAIEPVRTPTGGDAWLIVSSLPASDVLGPVNRAAYLSLGVAALVVVASLIGGWWAMGWSLRPVNTLTEAARAIAVGHWPAVPETKRSDEIGVLARALSTMIDACQRHEAELHAARVMAEQAAEAKSKFLAAASHDLRQPVQALFMLVASLAAGHFTAREQTIVGHLGRALEALKDLLDALLDVSRLDAGQIVPDIQAVPIREVLERVAADFASRAQAKGLKFSVVQSSAVVLTDPMQFIRILRNLVENALRYTQAGGILIGCRRRGDQLIVEVLDTGVGIPPDKLQEIFDEFVQLANPARTRDLGLGLGLSIVKRLCEILGHRIEVRSVLGRGSVFSVAMPTAHPHRR